ncbi:carbohydrate ABC transporter permease [Nonomuraea pusilla]|uniref:carbohydrate ABC transporter permease n=1 Tax=Nonomuraea pusilla TaxID=46177 RepID=UPI00333423B8
MRPAAARAATTAAIALVMVPALFPLYWMVISSLKGPQELQTIPPTWWPRSPSLSAFTEVFDAVPFGAAFVNSLLLAGLATASVLVTSVLAGYVFAKCRFRGREALFWGVVATMFLPPVVTLVPLYWMVSSLGLADTYLGVLLPWLANPFGVFLMRQFVADVPDELLDAARIDGAGELRIVWRVVTPLLKPAVVSLAIFSFVFYWNSFIWPLSILQDDAKFPVVLALSQLLNYSTSVQYQNVVMAGALIASLPTIAVFLVAQRVFVASLSRTGVKG